MKSKDSITLSKSQLWKGTAIILAIFLVVTLIVLNADNYNNRLSKFFNNDNEVWKTIDLHEKSVLDCGVDISSWLNTLDYEMATVKINFCREKINEAIKEINLLEIKYPKNEELKVAKIDLEASGQLLDSINIIIDLHENRDGYTNFEKIIKTERIQKLINDLISKHNLIETSYSHTKYYSDYYWRNPDENQKFYDEVSEMQKIVADGLKDLQTCPHGYVFGSDYECHQECGKGTYCTSGQCFYGKCVSCPTGTYLATDGKCYAY